MKRNKPQFARLMELDRQIQARKYPNCLTFEAPPGQEVDGGLAQAALQGRPDEEPEGGSAEKKTLTSAVTKEADADLFTGCGMGNLWTYVAKVIKGGVAFDGTSPSARIVVGHASDSEEPSQETKVRDDSNRESCLRAVSEKSADGASDSSCSSADNGGTEVETGVDDEDESVNPQPTDDEDAAADGGRSFDAGDFVDPDPDTAIISLVVCRLSDAPICRVEVPTRSTSNSSVIRLAEAFADWIAKKHSVLLEGDATGWRRRMQNDVLDSLKKHRSGLDGIGAADMSRFVNRTCLVWPRRTLRLTSLFQEEMTGHPEETERDSGPHLIV